MSSPSRQIRPAMGRMKPLTVLSAVDLPLPFAPSRATTSPRPTVRSTPRRIWTCPYPATRPSTASTAPSVAKIGLQHVAIARHFRRGIVGDHLPVVEDDDAVRHRHDEFDCMLDEDDRDPFFLYQAADDAEQLLAHGGGEADRRLVEEEQGWARSQRAD